MVRATNPPPVSSAHALVRPVLEAERIRQEKRIRTLADRIGSARAVKRQIEGKLAGGGTVRWTDPAEIDRQVAAMQGEIREAEALLDALDVVLGEWGPGRWSTSP